MPSGKFGESDYQAQQQNLDKIETICEVSSPPVSDNPDKSAVAAGATPDAISAAAVAHPPGSNPVSSVAAGFRDRFRHCSESAAALVHKLPPFRASISATSAGGGSNGHSIQEATKGRDLEKEEEVLEST